MLKSITALAATVALLLIAVAPAHSQRGGLSVRVYPSYGYPGYYPFYGYNGFYSNGFSMYGPPVPTYGTVPGYFGGADQRLSNFNYAPTPPYHAPGRAQTLPPELDRQVVDLPIPADDAPAAAMIEVRVPVTMAKLWIDGERTTQTGTRRLFHSPPLEKGKKFQYDIEARWTQDGKAVTRTETLTVEGGQRFQVDFRPPEMLPEQSETGVRNR